MKVLVLCSDRAEGALFTEEEFILRWHDNLEGTPTRIAIAVSYLNAVQDAPIHAAYHLD